MGISLREEFDGLLYNIKKLEKIDDQSNLIKCTAIRGRGWAHKEVCKGMNAVWAGPTNRSNILIESPCMGSYFLSCYIKFFMPEFRARLKVGILDRWEKPPELRPLDEPWYELNFEFNVTEEDIEIGLISIEFYCDIATNDRELRTGTDQTLKSFAIAHIRLKKVE